MVALKWTEVGGRTDEGQACRTPHLRASSVSRPPAFSASRSGRAISGRHRPAFFWRRAVVVFAIASLGAFAWQVVGWLVPMAGAQSSRPGLQVSPEHTYIAKPGDTVWAIAMKFSGDGDPRPLADRLEAEISGGVLQPGDRLVVP